MVARQPTRQPAPPLPHITGVIELDWRDANAGNRPMLTSDLRTAAPQCRVRCLVDGLADYRTIDLAAEHVIAGALTVEFVGPPEAVSEWIRMLRDVVADRITREVAWR